MMIRRFEVDRWRDVHVSQLKVNDEIFTNKDGICIVTGEPYLDDGKTVIPAKKPEPKDIVIDLSLDAHHPYVAEISDCLNLVSEWRTLFAIMSGFSTQEIYVKRQ